MYDIYRTIEQGETIDLPAPIANVYSLPVDRIIAIGDYFTPSGALKVSDLLDDIKTAQATAETFGR